MSLDLRSLIGKLGDTSRRALEGAAGLAVSRTHFDVELEHWLFKLVEEGDTDIPRILRHFEVDPDRFLQQLDQALTQLKSGNSRRPDLSETIEQLTREGWVWCSVNFGLARVRSGGLFLAALEDPRLRRRLVGISPEIDRVGVESLESELLDIVAGSREDREVSAIADATQRDVRPAQGGAGGATPALDRYTRDLTVEAREGRMDPVLAREPEVRQIIDILGRRRQNNPILTGEAGVGKTAVVEGFAQRVVSGDVPEPLQGVAVRELDMGLLQAGAGVKGEFENRLKQVIEEVKNSPTPIVLFIDEIHTMVGAGGAEGQNDAANLLKPALARGELRTIGATTWAEYKKYFEKDPALTRRFQMVKVEEPSEPMAVRMMRGVAAKFEAHHGVRILDEALVDSVRLSHRYIPARQLPDKSVSVLDTACAKVAVGQAATPAPIEDRRARSNALETELAGLRREVAAGASHDERIAEIEGELAELSGELEALEDRWENESDLVAQIREPQNALAAANEARSSGDADAEGAAADPVALRTRLDGLKAELASTQGEEPLVMPSVDGQAIAEVISSSTGIPVGKMLADEILAVLRLSDTLKERVIGQDHALDAIASRIHTARADLDNPKKPIGVFMLLGPSGVGKTETAMRLADEIYGGEQNAIVINMSEYQEAHTVSSLKGSPPGYVGYGEGGVLTEAVRRRPYSVVLLDEVEKAHPDVMELFFQVFDKGMLEDGEGRQIDFKNTVIILTTNVGSDTIMKLCADPDLMPDPEALLQSVRPELLKAFPAALLGRLVEIPFYPIAGDVLRRIIELKLGTIRRRVKANHGAELVLDDEIIERVAARCTEGESGARAIDNILTHSMLPAMSAEVLASMAAGRTFSKIEAKLGEGGDFAFSLT